MTDQETPPHEHVDEPARSFTSTELIEQIRAEADVAKRLTEIERKIDILLELTCPVCGPRMAARMHPEQEAEITAVARGISSGERNGHSRR